MPYPDPADLAVETAVDDTHRLISGDYSSPAWINDRSTGTHMRTLDGNRLDFQIGQTVDGGS